MIVLKKDDSFGFKIYRKETNNNRYIDGFSNHSLKHKYASIANLVHRAIHIPLSPEDRREEISYIKDICMKNHLSVHSVDKYLRKFERDKFVSEFTSLTKVEKQRKWVKLHYNGILTDKLGKLCNRFGLDPAMKSDGNIGQLLPRTYNSNNSRFGSGVYQLSCNDCSAVYIGQTGKGFEHRFNQHERAIANNKPDSSNFARHIISSGHSTNVNYDNNCTILAKEDHLLRRCFLEGCFIKKAVNNSDITCVNEVRYPFNSNLINFACTLDKY